MIKFGLYPSGRLASRILIVDRSELLSYMSGGFRSVSITPEVERIIQTPKISPSKKDSPDREPCFTVSAMLYYFYATIAQLVERIHGFMVAPPL